MDTHKPRHGGVVANYIEQEGLARLTITILAMTCLGALAFTWGYAEVRLSAAALLLLLLLLLLLPLPSLAAV